MINNKPTSGRYPWGADQNYKITDMFTFGSNEEAKNLIGILQNIIDRYGYVSVAELYDFTDVQLSVSTANHWGWYDMSGCTIEPDDSGLCLLQLPRPVKLNVTKQALEKTEIVEKPKGLYLRNLMDECSKIIADAVYDEADLDEIERMVRISAIVIDSIKELEG